MPREKIASYATDLERFIGHIGDIAEKIREALVASDELELSELIDDLLEELRAAAEFIESNRTAGLDDAPETA
jgi:hypothetical protein